LGGGVEEVWISVFLVGVWVPAYLLGYAIVLRWGDKGGCTCREKRLTRESDMMGYYCHGHAVTEQGNCFVIEIAFCIQVINY
jgi:hypothetical protein